MNEIDKICLNFQGDIVEIFNKYNNIPFILKYYLFKEVWQKIEQQKINNDYNVSQQKQQSQLTKEEAE